MYISLNFLFWLQIYTLFYKTSATTENTNSLSKYPSKDIFDVILTMFYYFLSSSAPWQLYFYPFFLSDSFFLAGSHRYGVMLALLEPLFVFGFSYSLKSHFFSPNNKQIKQSHKPAHWYEYIDIVLIDTQWLCLYCLVMLYIFLNNS